LKNRYASEEDERLLLVDRALHPQRHWPVGVGAHHERLATHLERRVVDRDALLDAGQGQGELAESSERGAIHGTILVEEVAAR
jgi:hypothetical protein